MLSDIVINRGIKGEKEEKGSPGQQPHLTELSISLQDGEGGNKIGRCKMSLGIEDRLHTGARIDIHHVARFRS